MMVFIVFNLVMLLLILFVIYWFWLSHSKSKVVKNSEVKILVKDGVYSPSNLVFQIGQEINLIFLRDDNTACSEIIVFKELNKEYQLPYQQSFLISLGKLPKGSYSFSCQMNMYKGQLKVE